MQISDIARIYKLNDIEEEHFLDNVRFESEDVTLSNFLLKIWNVIKGFFGSSAKDIALGILENHHNEAILAIKNRIQMPDCKGSPLQEEIIEEALFEDGAKNLSAFIVNYFISDSSYKNHTHQFPIPVESWENMQKLNMDQILDFAPNSDGINFRYGFSQLKVKQAS